MKKITIFLIVFLSILYFRSFTWLVNVWLTDSYYSHGFLIPIVSIFIAWKNIHRFEPESAPFENGLIIFIPGLILYIIGFIKLFPFLSALSFLFVTSGLILYFYGKNMMRCFLFPVSLLIFAIPLPVLILKKIAYSLQHLSAYYSTLLIKIFGVQVTRIGSEIHLQNASFTIGLPCSGMNSLISLLALAVIFIYILKCQPSKKIALLCVTVPIAIIANILRITLLLLLANHYGAEIAMRFFHDFSSLFLFIIAFIFLIIISTITGCKVRTIEDRG
ncbi:MAG: exosortase/archaeosortase family protein [Methanosarcinales archaeon]|nr:MAG: exosortase/archaeosortase family protein [Methanosarcinales archaeon]